jgi:hypothetical protein
MSAIGALCAQSKLSEKTVETLLACLQHSDSAVRSSTTNVLCAQSNLSEKAFDTLLGCQRAEISNTRECAIKVLGV